MDYYDKKTKDLLVNINPRFPRWVYQKQPSTRGSVLNRGFELEASWHDRVGDFSYSHYPVTSPPFHNEVTLPPIPHHFKIGRGCWRGWMARTNPIRTALRWDIPYGISGATSFEGVNPRNG